MNADPAGPPSIGVAADVPRVIPWEGLSTVFAISARDLLQELH